MRGVVLMGKTYAVRMRVPADALAVIGKRELLRSLKTRDYREACKIAPPIVAKFNAEIARARGGAETPDRRRQVQIALANWSLRVIEQPAAREPQTPLEAIEAVTRLERAVADPEGWRGVPDFDARSMELLASVGLRLRDADLAPYRQEIAVHMLMAERHREKVRAIYAEKSVIRAAEGRLKAIEAMPASDIAVSEPELMAPATRPSITISTLFGRWIVANPPKAEKERGRLEHQFRRLVEFTGDIPANHITKVQITDYLGLVARFPGRKRSTQLNALPIAKLVERFETLNDSLEENGGEPMRTLTATTANEWFQSYRRTWQWAVDLEMPGFVRNPWDGMSKFVRGSQSIKRRAFSPEEVGLILRALEGQVGARKWLPILALYHGARLSELAALPRADWRDTYFDLNAKERSLKSNAATRLVPLHPRAEGFKAWANEQSGKWLFEELNHAHKYGPGHDFSEWFANFLDGVGLTDPALCFHSLRHTWKRQARQSSVKEEIHDVISGHKGANSVSRGYGAGADIEALREAMALIEFPTP